MGDRLIRMIRLFLSKLILAFDRFFPAKKEFTRTAEHQAQVDREAKNLTLYQFEACPFCVKVRRGLKRLDLRVELKDAKQPAIAEELKTEGGELQTPCLRVSDAEGKVQWIYESDDILAYLTRRFHNPAISGPNYS